MLAGTGVGSSRGNPTTTRLEAVEEDTYTTAQVARILRVSPQRVRDLVANGKIEARKEGDRWLIDARSVHARLDERPSKRPERPQEAAERHTELVEERVLERALGRLEGRLELTEKAESTIREERNFLRTELAGVRDQRDNLVSEIAEERADRERLEAELELSRRSWWRRLLSR
jgi:excisionase family DNA binding protein